MVTRHLTAPYCEPGGRPIGLSELLRSQPSDSVKKRHTKTGDRYVILSAYRQLALRKRENIRLETLETNPIAHWRDEVPTKRNSAII